jgi:SAM-dependent methyltransferase
LRALANQIAQSIDRVLLHSLGLTYARLTRDHLIHDRCEFLLCVIRRLVTPASVRVLDVGCGSGLVLAYLYWANCDIIREYVGIDLNVERLRSRYKFVRIPHRFHAVNLDSDWNLGRFDLIWCSEVIEHLLEDRRLLRKMRDHLAPGGSIAITTPSRAFVDHVSKKFPAFGEIQSTQDGGHVRRGYLLSDCQDLAREAGLTLVAHAWISPLSMSDIGARFIRRGGFRRPRVGAKLASRFVIGASPETASTRYISIAALFALKADRS